MILNIFRTEDYPHPDANRLALVLAENDDMETRYGVCGRSITIRTVCSRATSLRHWPKRKTPSTFVFAGCTIQNLDMVRSSGYSDPRTFLYVRGLRTGRQGVDCMIAEWTVYSLSKVVGGDARRVASGSDPLADMVKPRAFMEDLVRRWGGDTADFSGIVIQDGGLYEWFDERPDANHPVSIFVRFTE